MTNKYDFETLTNRINAKLKEAKTKLEATSKAAESGFTTTEEVVDNFIAASAQKLEAEKSLVANQAGLTDGFFKAMQSISGTFDSVHASLAKIGSALSASADHQIDFVGATDNSLTVITDGSDQ